MRKITMNTVWIALIITILAVVILRAIMLIPKTQSQQAIELTIMKSNLGWITDNTGKTYSANETYLYPVNTILKLHIVPAWGQDFVSWTINGQDYTDNPVTITLTENTIIILNTVNLYMVI